MAHQAPHESARIRRRGRNLDPSSQLPRDRSLAGFSRHAAAPLRATRHSAPRAQRNSGCGRLCAGVQERPLTSPEMAAARQAVERVLKGHEPFPALAVDRHWQFVSANAAVTRLLAGVDEVLLKPPVNVLRLSLHPGGLAPRIANLAEWRAHLLMRLRGQIDRTADAALIDLLSELTKFPARSEGRRVGE